MFGLYVCTENFCSGPYSNKGKFMAGRSRSSGPSPDYGKVTSAAELGRLVRRKRKETGALQDSAAAMCGVGTKFLSQLENGKETAELGKVLQVLKALGLELYLFPRSADPLKER